jgi:hypothetical protein
LLTAGIFFLCYIRQSLHQQVCHLLNRARLLKLFTEEQFLYLTFKSISDFLVSIRFFRLLFLFMLVVPIFEIFLFRGIIDLVVTFVFFEALFFLPLYNLLKFKKLCLHFKIRLLNFIISGILIRVEALSTWKHLTFFESALLFG